MSLATIMRAHIAALGTENRGVELFILGEKAMRVLAQECRTDAFGLEVYVRANSFMGVTVVVSPDAPATRVEAFSRKGFFNEPQAVVLRW